MQPISHPPCALQNTPLKVDSSEEEIAAPSHPETQNEKPKWIELLKSRTAGNGGPMLQIENLTSILSKALTNIRNNSPDFAEDAQIIIFCVNLIHFFSDIQRLHPSFFEWIAPLEIQFLSSMTIDLPDLLSSKQLDPESERHLFLLCLKARLTQRYTLYSALISLLSDNAKPESNDFEIFEKWLEKLEECRSQILIKMTGSLTMAEVDKIKIANLSEDLRDLSKEVKAFNQLIKNLEINLKISSKFMNLLHKCRAFFSWSFAINELSFFYQFDWRVGIEFFESIKDRYNEYLELKINEFNSYKLNETASWISTKCLHHYLLYRIPRGEFTLREISQLSKHYYEATYPQFNTDFQPEWDKTTQIELLNLKPKKKLSLFLEESEWPLHSYLVCHHKIAKAVSLQEEKIRSLPETSPEIQKEIFNLQNIYSISHYIAASMDNKISNFPGGYIESHMSFIPYYKSITWDLLKGKTETGDLVSKLFKGAQSFYGTDWETSIKNHFFWASTDTKGEYLWLPLQLMAMRCVNIIGEYQRFVRYNSGTKIDVAICEQRLYLLNIIYENLIIQLENMVQPEVTLGDHLAEEMKKIFLFGAYSKETISVEMIQREKKLADCGYNMIQNLMEYLQSVAVPNDKTWMEVLYSEIQKFIDWSDRHPYLVGDMLSDILHTVAVIEGDSPVSHLYSSLKGKLIVHSFFGNFGIPETKSFTPDEEDLKYLAIHDLCQLMPQLTAFIKGAVNGSRSLPILGTILGGLFNLYKTRAVQTVNRNMQPKWAEIAVPIIKVLQGDSFHEVLRCNAELQMIKLAGVMRKAWLNPKKFWNYIELEFLKWWHPLKTSPLKEKIYRTLIHGAVPALGLFSAAASLALFSAATATLVAALTLPASFLLYRGGSRLLDWLLDKDTVKEANYLFLNNRLNADSSRRLLLKKKVASIKKQLYNSNALFMPAEQELSEEQQKWFNENAETVKAIKRDYVNKFEKKQPTSISELLKLHHTLLYPEKLARKLEKKYITEEDGSDIIQALTVDVIRHLNEQCLDRHIQRILKEKCFEFFAEDKDESDAVLDFELSPDLEEHAELVEEGALTKCKMKRIVKKLAENESRRKKKNLSPHTDDVLFELYGTDFSR